MSKHCIIPRPSRTLVRHTVHRILSIHSREPSIRHLRIAILRRSHGGRRLRARVRSLAARGVGVAVGRALLVVRRVEEGARGLGRALQWGQGVSGGQDGRAVDAVRRRGGCAAAERVEVAGRDAARVGRALRAGHGVHGVQDRLVLVLHAAGALVLQPAYLAGSGGRRAFSVVAAFAPERLVGVVLHVLVELLEEEGALQTHLLDAPVQAQDALAGRVVGLLNVVDAPAEFNAFAIVGAFD
jgi:hypothetical protein